MKTFPFNKIIGAVLEGGNHMCTMFIALSLNN